MKTTIDIADSLLTQAKQVARASGVTLRELTEEGLKLALERRGTAARRPLRVVAYGEPAKEPLRSLDWELTRDAVYPSRCDRCRYEHPRARAPKGQRMA